MRIAGNHSTLYGPFTICLTDGPGFVPCIGPSLAPPVYTNAGNTTATIGFTPGPNNVGPYVASLQINPFFPPTPPPVTFSVTPSSIALTGLVPGTDYTLTVVGSCPSGGSAVGIIYFIVPAPNDDPCGALALPLDPGAGCTPLSGAASGTTITAPNGYTNPGCAGVANLLDLWYKVMTPATGPGSSSVVITASNVTSVAQLRLFTAPSCNGPFTELACSARPTPYLGAPPLLATGLVPSTTYYVCVSGFQGGMGNGFTICASALPAALPCPALGTLYVAPTLITATTALVALAPAAGSASPISFTVTYTPAGGVATILTVPYVPVPGSTPYTPLALSGLQPNTTYTVTAVVNCGAGGQSGAVSTTFTTPALTGPPPPANDDCTGATPLPVGTACAPLLTTTLGATNSLLPITLPYPQCAPYNGADVWYRAVVPANGIVQVATGPVSGSALTDTGLTLYTGTCGGLTEIACNNNSSATNLFSQVRGTGLTPGSTVYARAWGVSAGTGDFTICATTDVTCPLVSNLLATALTPTSATLSFTLPAGNSGYVLTYRAAGGPVQMLPVTASPVLLSGLLPGTTYVVTLTGNCAGAPAGTVGLGFTTPVVPGCAAPSAVYVANVTPTTAGVGFVPNPAASGYTLTYQAAGGPLQTLTPAPTASPVQLTGLTPFTAYTVCLTSTCANGLTSAARCAALFFTPLAGRSGGLAAQLGLFPNPAHQSATLTVPAVLLRQVGLLTIVDALGRAVRQRYVTPTAGATAETRAELDLSGLPPGVYSVRLLSSAGPLTRRLVVE